jgi:hypothetical protein
MPWLYKALVSSGQSWSHIVDYKGKTQGIRGRERRKEKVWKMRRDYVAEI